MQFDHNLNKIQFTFKIMVKFSHLDKYIFNIHIL